jgi:hypothetical protein
MLDMRLNVLERIGIRDRRDSNDRNQECFIRFNGISFTSITADERGAEEDTSVELVSSWRLILPLPPVYNSRGGI